MSLWLTDLFRFNHSNPAWIEVNRKIGIKQLRLKLVSVFCLGLLQTVAVADTASIEVITLQNRPATEIRTVLTPLLETGEVVSAESFNLIVKASPARVETIRTLIQRLDVRLHNLLISVLQSSHKSAEQLNAEAAIVASPATVRMRGMTGNTRDFDKQRNAQRLHTLEGQAAHIEVGQIRTVDDVTLYHSAYSYPAIAANPQWQQASSGFAVIPRLLGNNELAIDIAPWSERFLRNGAITSQQVQTSIRAKLGEWVEIGGIGQSDSNQHGFNGLNYTTRDYASRILIKVELAD